MKKKVAVAMSGGVDSSLTAALLIEQGYDVIGVTMTLSDESREAGGSTAVSDAKKVADALNIPHYVVNYHKKFKDDVIKYFISEYAKGRTPKNKDVNNFLLQPVFNFNTLVIDFLDSTQVIRCSNGHEFRYSEINQFRKYNMKCPICLESDIISNCKVIFKYTEIKKQFEEKEREKKIRFTFVGYLIMDLLKKMQKALPLQKIGETLDYSTTTLQVHIRILIEQNMIAIDNEPTQTLKKEFYVITKKGDDFLQRIERFLSKQINTR